MRWDSPATSRIGCASFPKERLSRTRLRPSFSPIRRTSAPGDSSAASSMPSAFERPDGAGFTSDDVQCLGNVFVMLATQERQERTMPASTKSSDAFLGAVNNVDSKAVAYALAEADHKSYVVFETTDFSDLVAQMLASGS